MIAKNNDTDRVVEIFSVIQTARSRINASSITHNQFINAASCDIPTQAIIDGINLCVYRIAEEAHALSDVFKGSHQNISWSGIRGLRNIVAHAYGEVAVP